MLKNHTFHVFPVAEMYDGMKENKSIKFWGETVELFFVYYGVLWALRNHTLIDTGQIQIGTIPRENWIQV